MKKILVAVDGSKSAVKAVEQAIEFSKELKDEVEITALYVVGKKAAQDELMHCLDKAHIDSTRQKRLEKAIEALEASGLPYKTQILEGNRGRTVGQYAKEEEINWIFVGSRGHNKLQKMVLGSVSEKIIEHAPCPVIVVKVDRKRR